MKKIIISLILIFSLMTNFAYAAPPSYKNNYAYIYGYNDSTMGANGQALRCEVSSMIYRLVKQNNRLEGFVYDKTKEPIYEDLKDTWFRSAIEYMVYKGAFSTEVDSIHPYEPISRLEAFRLIAIGLGFTKRNDYPGKEYSKILKKAGYIQGDENGDLLEYKYITRAEFCTINNRIINRDKAKLRTKNKQVISAETYGFTDLKESDWYYETMLRATSAYDKNGFVDLEARGIRNEIDDYQ